MSSRKATTSEHTLESEDDTTQRFTIGKVDAGIAVLISDAVHLIEFPSILLPRGVGPGSIVNISCTRNERAEKRSHDDFWSLQQSIFDEFGFEEPSAPTLRVRNVTQTSVTLEWDKLKLARSELLSLAIWRNGQRLTAIPNALSNTSTKLSGLGLNMEYSFHLVMKTTAGQLNSNVVKVRTHTIEQTSGISVCFGYVKPRSLLDDARKAIDSMNAKMSDKIQIDTTHFVATAAASADHDEQAQGDARTAPAGSEYLKAVQLSIPVVSPEWVIACAREKKMVGIANYYSVGTVNNAASISSTGQVAAASPSLSSPRIGAAGSGGETRRMSAVAQEKDKDKDKDKDKERQEASLTASVPVPPKDEPEPVAKDAQAATATANGKDDSSTSTARDEPAAAVAPTTANANAGALPVTTGDEVAEAPNDDSAEKVTEQTGTDVEAPAAQTRQQQEAMATPSIVISEGDVADDEDASASASVDVNDDSKEAAKEEEEEEEEDVQDLEEVSLQ